MTYAPYIEHFWVAVTLLLTFLKGLNFMLTFFTDIWSFFVALTAAAIASKVPSPADQSADEAQAKAQLDAAMSAAFDQAATALNLPAPTVKGLKAVEQTLSGAAVKLAEQQIAAHLPS